MRDIFVYSTVKDPALIKAPVLASAILCGASVNEMEALLEYASCLGLAFQIKDDILDVEGDPADMGKSAGSDEDNGKYTFIKAYGVEGSKKRLEETVNRAIAALNIFKGDTCFLTELAIYIEKRNN